MQAAEHRAAFHLAVVTRGSSSRHRCFAIEPLVAATGVVVPNVLPQESFLSNLGVAFATPGDLDGDGVQDVVLSAATMRGADSFPGAVLARSGAGGASLWLRRRGSP